MYEEQDLCFISPPKCQQRRPSVIHERVGVEGVHRLEMAAATNTSYIMIGWEKSMCCVLRNDYGWAGGLDSRGVGGTVR